jgi:hypothetical protein
MRSRTQRLTISWVVEAHGEDLARVRKGAARVAELADVLGVPLTWAVDARCARSLANWLNERRERRRLDNPDTMDETIVLWLDTASWLDDAPEPSDPRLVAERRVREHELFRERVASDRNRVGDALPWARPTIAGADFKNDALVAALEGAGFVALWGYRWNEASSRAQDRGCPFGYFVIGRDRYQSGGTPSRDLVGVPRDVGDLSFRRSVPPTPVELPSSDSVPATKAAVEPFVAALERIRANVEHNLWFGVTFPTDAEEAASWGETDTDAVTHLWNRARELGFQAVSLADAVATYRERFGETEPTTVVWTTDDENGSTVGRSVFHYDARAQLIFDDGVLAPVEFSNYVSPSSQSRYLSEYEAPTLVSFVPTREREQLRLDFSLDAPKPMPYALCLWGDHRHLRLLESNVLELRTIGSDAVLVLLDLVTGANDFSLVLTI